MQSVWVHYQIEDSVKIKRFIMENLPLSQERVHIDELANRAFLDLNSVNPSSVALFEVFGMIKALHDEQSLFIFGDGTVAATAKGLIEYE